MEGAGAFSLFLSECFVKLGPVSTSHAKFVRRERTQMHRIVFRSELGTNHSVDARLPVFLPAKENQCGSYLHSHLSHKDRCEDVVGHREEDPLLSNKEEQIHLGLPQ